MAFGRSQRETSSSSSSSYSSSSPPLNEPDNSNTTSVSDEHLSKLRDLVTLPSRNSVVLKRFCQEIGLSDELYEIVFRNPRLVFHPLEDQVRNQQRELNELKAEVKILKAHDQGNSDRIKELESRKVHNPATYEESLVYIGAAEGEDFDTIRVRAQMALQEASNSNEGPAFMVEQAFLNIAVGRGEDDLNLLRETSKSGIKQETKHEPKQESKQEIKSEPNETKSTCNNSADGSKPDQKNSLKREHWTDEDRGDDLRDVIRKRLRFFLGK